MRRSDSFLGMPVTVTSTLLWLMLWTTVDSEISVHEKYRVYDPTWPSLDKRPLPQWYDQAKIGIFIHWGVYSVPAYPERHKMGAEWFWYRLSQGDADIQQFVNTLFGPTFTYKDFGPLFEAKKFNPLQWAELFAKSGAKYVVLTAKHHDGYALFPSYSSENWNSVAIGPKMDIVEALSAAVKKMGMKFGVYYSLYEWFDETYVSDRDTSFTTSYYVQTKVRPDIEQLINHYKPSVLWADGDWEANSTYWKAREIFSWLYNASPVKHEIVVNDRWGNDVKCRHSDFLTCDDRYNPGHLMKRKWENAFTLDETSWGFRQNLKVSEVLTVKEILKSVVSTVSCGGNALINVGPDKDGIIPLVFQERLLQLGEWLEVNGEAIYDTSPWFHQKDSLNPNVWYTCRKEKYNYENPVAMPQKYERFTEVYAIFLKWPANNVLRARDFAFYMKRKNRRVDLLEDSSSYKNLKWRIVGGDVEVFLPNQTDVNSRFAWTLTIREEFDTSTFGYRINTI